MIRVTLRATTNGAPREIVVGTQAQADAIAAVLHETSVLAFAAGREAAFNAGPTLTFRNAQGDQLRARIATVEEANAIRDALDSPAGAAVQAFMNNRPRVWLSMKGGTVKPVHFLNKDEAETFNTWATEQVQPAPLPVAIASMPTRETTTAVKRDADGNIKTTTQTEKDAG